MTDESIIHFNPWRDFNDAAPAPDAFGIEPDPAQIARFLYVVFGYCDGLIPVRGFVDKAARPSTRSPQPPTGRPIPPAASCPAR